MKRLLKYADASTTSAHVSFVLLLLRLLVGIAFLFHGWSKIQNPFGWMPPEAPVPAVLQALAALAEFGGGVALILGLLTRVAAFGLICTMGVAVLFHVSLGDPFVGPRSYELASVYLVLSMVFLSVGPGRLSLDSKILR